MNLELAVPWLTSSNRFSDYLVCPKYSPSFLYSCELRFVQGLLFLFQLLFLSWKEDPVVFLLYSRHFFTGICGTQLVVSSETLHSYPFQIYLRRGGEIVCVYQCVSLGLCAFVFHCHAKDKQPCPVPSGAKPAGCRSCFCFVQCSVFSPRHTLLWRAFHLLSLPLCVCRCGCVSVCVFIAVTLMWGKN